LLFFDEASWFTAFTGTAWMVHAWARINAGAAAVCDHECPRSPSGTDEPVGCAGSSQVEAGDGGGEGNCLIQSRDFRRVPRTRQ
ncbi:hypothetical protein, partial [Nocardia sp. NPDC005998]|uniref:hypothetical protein n=1 Tax=Nocardia sp. NPDC005998 TaxID=3156894 RepID=UPI0033AA9403